MLSLNRMYIECCFSYGVPGDHFIPQEAYGEKNNWNRWDKSRITSTINLHHSTLNPMHMSTDLVIS